METIIENKAQPLIAEVISEHVTLQKRGNKYVGLCPFHAESEPSFTVDPDKGTFHCFGCGRKGDSFDFLSMLGDITNGTERHF